MLAPMSQKHTRWALLLVLLTAAALVALSACGGDDSGADGEPDAPLGEQQPPEEHAEWGAEGEAAPPLQPGKADAYGESLAAYSGLPAHADMDAPLQVLFAPDDPTVNLEEAWIDRVRDARLADAANYPEGDNPYRIRYAVYNLSNQRLAHRLADAEQDGVDVQVLIEADQLDKDWTYIDEVLSGRGLQVVCEHDQAEPDELLTADLIGIRAPGLMHLKTRLFETPEWSALITGSMNPNSSSVVNEETQHLIRDPRIVSQYAANYEAVLHDRPIVNRWSDESPLNVLFTPADEGLFAGRRVLEWLQEEDERILLMVFSLRDISAPGVDGGLVDILGAKVAEGVPVYVITDRKQADGIDANGNSVYWDDRTDDRLREAGVHVYECINDGTRLGPRNPYVAMHHKAAILGAGDRLRVITDAANWTASALGKRYRAPRNVESVLFVDSGSLDGGHTGRRYLLQWLRVLERYAHQSVELDGEPPFEEVRATLTEASGWARQPVAFVAEQAHTSWGESLWVVGDHDELGRWGQAHRGAPLNTDAERYPRWESVEPVRLPLGSPFEWKLVAWPEAGAPRWEAGDNYQAWAEPTVMATPGAPLRVVGRWRP